MCGDLEDWADVFYSTVSGTQSVSFRKRLFQIAKSYEKNVKVFKLTVEKGLFSFVYLVILTIYTEVHRQALGQTLGMQSKRGNSSPTAGKPSLDQTRTSSACRRQW